MDVGYTLPGSETVTLTGQTIDKLIRAGDGDAALLYLLIMKTRGKSTNEEAAARLGKSMGEILTAMATLSRLGLVHLNHEQGAAAHDSNAAELYGQDAPSVEPPEQSRKRSVEDLKNELESGSAFSSLVDETNKRLGKILTNDEVLRLLGMYADLEMEPAVILQLVTHCISESRPGSGGKMPTMGYIEKVAYQWEREGITTLESAESYFKQLDKLKAVRDELKAVLHIRDRELSRMEMKYVDSWSAMGFMSDAVAIAYDKTMLKTGDLHWGYIDSILSSWHNKGLHTVEEISQKEKQTDKSKINIKKQTAEQKFGQVSREEVDKMQRLLNRLKEE